MKKHKKESRKVTVDEGYSYMIQYPGLEPHQTPNPEYNFFTVKECVKGCFGFTEVEGGKFFHYEDALSFLKALREKRQNIVEYEIFD